MWHTYRTYYRFLWRYKGYFCLFVLSVVGFSFFQTIQPYFSKLFIDNIAAKNISLLIKILVFYGISRSLQLIFDNLSFWMGDKVVIPASRDARLQIFRKIQDLDFSYHLSKSTGSLISTFKRGDNAFFEFQHTINNDLANIIFSFFFVLILFSHVNPYFGLLMLISFAFNLLIARFLIKNNIKTRREFNHSEDEVSDIIVDNLINFETVKLFAKEDFELNRLKSKFIEWEKKLWGYSNSFRLIDFSVGTSANIGFMLILLLGLNLTIRTAITPGDYVMILGFVSTFYPKFFQLIYQLRNIAKNQADIEKYFAILDEETQIKDPSCPVKKTTVSGKIDFNNVTFSYPESKKGAVVDINLSIPAGRSVAFVGHSGVGKTTLVKLLMRFYDPQTGSITIDGVNIKDFNKSQLRSFMGVVPQEPILFNNTIGYNIAYGKDNATQKEIVAAAKMANLDDFIEKLPRQFDTQVGERGVKLSGGQKQRLAIARMILSNPDIIIFDEATSQLDSESEKKIQDAFWKAAKDKTTLIIAHRLSTIIRADRIVVMKNGRIVEVGSHSDLLSRPGSLYSHFWSLQTLDEHKSAAQKEDLIDLPI